MTAPLAAFFSWAVASNMEIAGVPPYSGIGWSIEPGAPRTNCSLPRRTSRSESAFGNRKSPFTRRPHTSARDAVRAAQARTVRSRLGMLSTACMGFGILAWCVLMCTSRPVWASGPTKNCHLQLRQKAAAACCPTARCSGGGPLSKMAISVRAYARGYKRGNTKQQVRTLRFYLAVPPALMRARTHCALRSLRCSSSPGRLGGRRQATAGRARCRGAWLGAWLRAWLGAWLRVAAR